MSTWIKRHKVITALIITFVAVPIFVVIFNALGAGIDLGGVCELMGVGWFFYGFAWLIWEYPKRRRHRAKTTPEEPKG